VKGIVPLVRAKSSGSEPLKRIEYCEDFLESNPSNVGMLLMLGQACRQAGLKQSAVHTYRDILSMKPDNKTALWALARLQEDEGNMEEALKAYTALQRLEPNNRELTFKLRNVQAARHMQSSGMEKAGSFREWLRDESVAVASEQRDTTQEVRNKQIAEAIRELEADNTNVTKITHLAGLYEFQGQYDKAVQVLEEGRRRLPDSYEVRERWAEVRLHAFERELREIARALKKDAGSQELQQKQKQIQQERTAIAAREYAWQVQQHPTDHGLRLKLGNALFELGRHDEAVAAFQAASRDPKLEADAAEMLGRCFFAKKQYDLAIEQYNRAIERHPTMDENGIRLQYLLAEAMEENGQKPEALRVYKRIYSHDITYRDVADKVAALTG
jgi:tetratricopeptide (TPR) repeat protein